MSVKKILLITSKTIINILILFIFFVPFYWMLLTAIKSLGQTMIFPPTFIVKSPHFENFLNAYSTGADH